jgi:hypothetical protein
MNQSSLGAAAVETSAQWEQRLRQHPQLLPQIVALLDLVELRRADSATADQAETGLRVARQQLGQQALGVWAQQRQQQVVTHRQAAEPTVQHHAQKTRLADHLWLRHADGTTPLRVGRRGAVDRPLSALARIQPRGYSRPLQAAMTDFGAEVSFAQARVRCPANGKKSACARRTTPAWLERQQTRLKANQLDAVLRDLAAHVETVTATADWQRTDQECSSARGASAAEEAGRLVVRTARAQPVGLARGASQWRLEALLEFPPLTKTSTCTRSVA